jgi:tetratricopeptide (TPR) repeat protein
MFTESSSLQTHHWFAHELTRQTLLTRLTPPRRKHLHLRVADALEGLQAADLDRHAAEIAHHLVEAGELADGERTARYLTMAAQRSLAGAAFEDALRHLSNALAVLPAHPTRQRADLLGRVGLAQRCLCRWQDAVATWDEAVAVLEALGEVDAAADLAWEYCFHLAWQYRFDDVLAVAQRALSALGDRSSPQRIRLLAVSAVGFGIKGDVAEASARIEEASRLAESDGDPRLLGEVGVVQTVHHDIFMQVREILPAGERAANMLREAGAVWHLADVLCFVDLGLVFQGRFAESDAVVAEVEPLAERTGHYAAATVLRRNGFPKLAARTANLRDLEELADVQFAVSTEMDSPVWLAYAHAMRGITRIWRGDWEAARVELDAGVGLATPGMWFGPQHGLLLLLHALLGERNQTWALLDSLDLPKAGTANLIGAWTLGILAAEAVSILGAEQRARTLHPLVVEALATGCLLRQYDGALIQRVAGMTAATAGLARSAEEHFETALRQAEELPHLMERPQVCHFYARFLVQRGGRDDHERAPDLLERAAAGYRGIGMPRHEAMARELLRSV